MRGLISFGVLIRMATLKLSEYVPFYFHNGTSAEGSPVPCHMKGGLHCSAGLTDEDRVLFQKLSHYARASKDCALTMFQQMKHRA